MLTRLKCYYAEWEKSRHYMPAIEAVKLALTR